MNILALVDAHWRALSLLLLATITILSLTPLEHLPPVPGGDKWHHAIAYAALMFPAALHRPRHWLLLAAFYLAWSGGIELIQPYVNRYGEWGDMAANAGGLFVGIVLASVAGKAFRRVPADA